MPAIIRVVHKERPFLMIDKETIRDLATDLPALGMLVVILAKKDDWRIRPEQLAHELKASEAKIYRLLARLMHHGYIRRDDNTRRLPDGTFERRTFYTVFEDKGMCPKDKQEVDTRIDGMVVPF